ncbi:MAG: hypothetical protein H0W50_05640 [Parachlamydiaceae bacterium]|nr:hypothetical protein [Parachlamydiaceae bacterium]
MLNKLLLTAIFSIAATSLQGDLAEAYFDVSAGYRRDKLSADIHSFDTQNTQISRDQISVKDLDLFQIGGKGFAASCDWFVRGEAFWGWSDNGKYKAASKVRKHLFSKSTAHLNHGKTKDFSLGVGYFLSLCAPFEIGPVAGWSYQSQEFNVKKAHFLNLDEGYDPNSRAHFEYNNHWKGPWLGADAKFNLLGFDLRAGYSYHWANWNAKWSMKNRSEERFTSQDSRKSSNAHGQVAYLDFFWGFCPFIDFGVGLKWQQWQVKKGKKKSVETPETQVARNQIQNAKWESFTVSLDFGISF